MKIEIRICDLCKEEYRMDFEKNSREIGCIKLDMKGCYYVQALWEKEVCSQCAYKIRDVINKIMNELYKD